MNDVDEISVQLSSFLALPASFSGRVLLRLSLFDRLHPTLTPSPFPRAGERVPRSGGVRVSGTCSPYLLLDGVSRSHSTATPQSFISGHALNRPTLTPHSSPCHLVTLS